MLTRYWQLPGGITAKEEVSGPVGWNLFWYCAFCGDIYARTWVPKTEAAIPWKALNGCCLRCAGSKWNIPGSVENIATVGWRVPLAVARYQVECELKFTRSEDHPYNEKEQ